MPHKICALIPTHNHHRALPGLLARLGREEIPVLVVDDGSNDETKHALAEIKQNHPDLTLLTLPVNGGKGSAIYEGLVWAHKQGYTHIFQIDADGQHSLDSVSNCMELSKRNPQALVSGQPIYDESMPLARRIGRWFTHVWVWIETLSFRITDSMCGFRIYPVEKTLNAIEAYTPGRRMDFDTEIMVRLFWDGTPVIMSPVRVIYPEGNTSNFDVLRDNWRITKMHTKLFFRMLGNLVNIIKNRPNYHTLDLPQETIHWASMKERSTLFGLFFFAFCYRLLGKRVCMAIGTPIVFYYYLRNTSQRHASQNFLQRAFDFSKNGEKPNSFKHFMAFFAMALDKFSAWTGHGCKNQIECTGSVTFEEIMGHNRGCMLLVSHLGNMEFCRAVAPIERKNQIHILLHSKNSRRYQQLLHAFNPLSTVNIIEVTEIGPDTLIYLKGRVEAGDCIVIAGDRIPLNIKGRITHATFMGAEAPFAQGPYILASLLECPVYMATAVPEGAKVNVSIELLAQKIVLTRGQRESQIHYYAQLFAIYLEKNAIKYPYQWFNFFDFWKNSPYINNTK